MAARTELRAANTSDLDTIFRTHYERIAGVIGWVISAPRAKKT